MKDECAAVLRPGVTIVFEPTVRVPERTISFNLYNPDPRSKCWRHTTVDPTETLSLVIVATCAPPRWRQFAPASEHWYQALVHGRLYLVRFYDSDFRCGYARIIDEGSRV